MYFVDNKMYQLTIYLFEINFECGKLYDSFCEQVFPLPFSSNKANCLNLFCKRSLVVETFFLR